MPVYYAKQRIGQEYCHCGFYKYHTFSRGTSSRTLCMNSANLEWQNEEEVYEILQKIVPMELVQKVVHCNKYTIQVPLCL